MRLLTIGATYTFSSRFRDSCCFTTWRELTGLLDADHSISWFGVAIAGKRRCRHIPPSDRLLKQRARPELYCLRATSRDTWCWSFADTSRTLKPHCTSLSPDRERDQSSRATSYQYRVFARYRLKQRMPSVAEPCEPRDMASRPVPSNLPRNWKRFL